MIDTIEKAVFDNIGRDLYSAIRFCKMKGSSLLRTGIIGEEN